MNSSLPSRWNRYRGGRQPQSRWQTTPVRWGPTRGKKPGTSWRRRRRLLTTRWWGWGRRWGRGSPARTHTTRSLCAPVWGVQHWMCSNIKSSDHLKNRLNYLVCKTSHWVREIWRLLSRRVRTSDFKSGTLAANLLDTWRDSVGARTGWSGVSLMWLCDSHLISSFYLSVTTRQTVWAGPSIRHISNVAEMSRKQETNKL